MMKGKILFGLFCLALAIGGLRAQAATATVKLTWTDTINPAGTGYNVRRGNSATACTSAATATDTCTLLNSTPLSVLAFTDTPALGGVYTYIVKAVNSIGLESVGSNLVIASLIPPAPPTLNCTLTITGSTVSGSCK